MYRVDVYLRVRRAVMVDGMSMREASRVFGLHRDTVRKMLAYSAPPGYRRQDPPRRPRLEPFTGVIDGILEADRQVPKKQRHTAKRIFERLRDEHGFDGQYTIVKDYVRERRRRTQEMFVPLSHAPGHAQCDFGEARVIIGGVERKAHYLVLDLPHSDGCFVKAYPAETTEAFLDGHVSAFASLGGVPQSILYDNTKLAVARILGDGRRQRTRAFTELQSHYLFEDRFGRPGKGNDKGKVEGMVEPGEPHVPDQHDPERVVRVSEAVGKGLSTGLAPDVFLPVHGVGGGAGHDHLDFALGVVLILPFGAESHQLPVKLDADPPAHADDHRLSVQLLQPGIEMFENILCNLPDPAARVQPALAPRPAARHRGDPPAPEDPPQLPSSPDAARRWPAGFPGDHGPDHPGVGIRTGKQRLDSTHIMSNIATLTRLGLFCETMRLFLRALRWEHPELRPGVPEGLLGRYLKEEDEATHYEDARTGEGRRRLSVCARDLYRLVDRFHGTTAAQLEEYRLLERLLREQCHVGKHQDRRPRDDDDDAGECKVPVALKDPKQVSADSLQSPHDPDVTYSGHKGKGYEVQVAETCHEENATQLITHVEVTPIFPRRSSNAKPSSSPTWR